MDTFNPNFVPKIERENKRTHNLFTLTEEEQQALTRRVEKSKGVVRIMIHPYYMQEKLLAYPGVKRRVVAERVKIVEQSFERIIGTKLSVPVFLFEERSRIESTKKKVTEKLQNAIERVM